MDEGGDLLSQGLSQGHSHGHNDSTSHGSELDEPSQLSEPAYVRRDAAMADDHIVMILAGREKKSSIVIPPLPHSTSRPNRLMLGEQDFDHLLGEVNGTKYGSGCRPELELVVIKLRGDDDPDIHTVVAKPRPASRHRGPTSSAQSVDTGDEAASASQDVATESGGNKVGSSSGMRPANASQSIEMGTVLPSQQQVALVVYDPAKSLFIYSLATEVKLLKMLSSFHNSQSQSAVPADSTGRDERPVCLEVSLWFSYFHHDVYHTIDELRIRCWRRFVRQYVLPVFLDERQVKHREEEMISQAEAAMRARLAALEYSDTDSSASGITRFSEAAEKERREKEAKAKEEKEQSKKMKEEDSRPKNKIAANKQLVKGISKRGMR